MLIFQSTSDFRGSRKDLVEPPRRVNSKERRHNIKLETLHQEDERFVSQWGNPEKHMIAHEEYEALSKALEGLTSTQKRRLILRLSGISCREIARQERVSVQSVSESIEGIRKKLVGILKHKPELFMRIH